MERYAKYDKAYIYAAFPSEKRTEAISVLDKMGEEGVRFWYSEKFNRREKQRIEGAFGVLLFATTEYARSEAFHSIVDTAVKCGQKILTVYLDDVPVTPWSELQLGTQQALFAEQLDEAFVAKLKEAYIFREMAVTTAQKQFQRKRAMTMISAPIIAATVLFFAVINPLLIAPAAAAEKLAKQWGLTMEDLESITALYIAGDQSFDHEVSGYFELPNRNQIIANEFVDGNNQSIGYIPVGTLNSEDLSILKYMPNLEELVICGNQITDISPIFECNKLHFLNLDANPITSLEGISALENLEDIRLTTTDITDPSPLWDCPKLRLVMIDLTNVSSISGVEKLRNLEHLNIQGTYVSDVSMLSENKNLELLIANNTEITSLPAFSRTENITLEIDATSVSDYSPLKTIESFKKLRLRGGTPSQLLPYIEGKTIEQFGWAGTDITSLTELKSLDVIGYLGLAWTDLTSLDGLEHFDGIWSLDIRGVKAITDLTPLLTIDSLEYVALAPELRSLAEEQLKEAKFVIEYPEN